MSNGPKDELLARITGRVRAMQVSSDLVDEFSAKRLGVNRTDHRVLDVLDQEGPVTAGRLAERCHLSPAAMTTAIDRLEARGYARRVADPGDRRRVLVEATPLLRERTADIFMPLMEAALAMKGRYTAAELEVVARFMEEAGELEDRHLERLAEMDPAKPG
jgi:DNA-binding MarR family transcriptional regulator